MIDYWHYSLILIPSSCLIPPLLYNCNCHETSRPCTGTLFLLQLKFFLRGVTFIHRLFCSKWIFSQAILLPGHFLILSDSRTFPRPGKWICCFPGCVGTLSKPSGLTNRPYILNRPHTHTQHAPFIVLSWEKSFSKLSSSPSSTANASKTAASLELNTESTTQKIYNYQVSVYGLHQNEQNKLLWYAFKCVCVCVCVHFISWKQSYGTCQKREVINFI